MLHVILFFCMNSICKELFIVQYFSASDIIFVIYCKCQHMGNKMTYKRKISAIKNISLIVFIRPRSSNKTPEISLLGKPQGVFLCWLLLFYFTWDYSSFASCFSAWSVIRFTFTRIDLFFNFSPAYCRVIGNTFFFKFLGFSFCHECFDFEGAFFTSRHFLRW